MDDGTPNNMEIRDSAIAGDVHLSQVTNDPDAIINAFIRGKEYSPNSKKNASIISSELLYAISILEMFSIKRVNAHFADEQFTLFGYDDSHVVALVLSNKLDRDVALPPKENPMTLHVSMMKELARESKIMNIHTSSDTIEIANRHGTWIFPTMSLGMVFPNVAPEIGLRVDTGKFSQMLQRFHDSKHSEFFFWNDAEGRTSCTVTNPEDTERLSEEHVDLGGKRSLSKFWLKLFMPFTKFDHSSVIDIRWGTNMPFYFTSVISNLRIAGFVAPMTVEFEDHY